YLLIGKSGTVATMLEHGVPVIVNRDDVQLAACPTSLQDHEPLLYKMGSDLPNIIGQTLNRLSPASRLPSTVTKLLEDLVRLTTPQASTTMPQPEQKLRFTGG
ncbi:MAG TPA: hypothetical protein V6D03_07575, partial [Candidatus Caenarcaniphilales bacterium]